MILKKILFEEGVAPDLWNIVDKLLVECHLKLSGKENVVKASRSDKA